MDPKHNETVKALFEKAQKGDHEAFSSVYHDYYAPIYRYLYLRTNDKDTTQDLCQEVFLKGYQSMSSFVLTSTNPIAYFYTIARNTLIDFYRKKELDIVSRNDSLETLPSLTRNAEEECILKEETRALYESIAELTEDQREVITLKCIEGLSTKEIAALLDKQEDAIRQLQVRGLRSLGSLLRKKYEQR